LIASITRWSSGCAAAADVLETLPYRHIVVADFEFEFGGHTSFEEASRSGERPRPVCMVAKELRSGQTWRVWRGEFGSTPPFPIGPDALFAAYYSSAEFGCFHAWNWPKPANILDLFAEFRDRTNGLTTPAGSGLVGALAYFGLDPIAAQEKDRLRLLILRGGPWPESERKEILEYCETDIVALEQLLPAMLPRIDLPRALLRGRYMAAAATMEWNGTPIDTATLELLREHWTDIQDDLIAAIDTDYGVYEGRTFKVELFEAFLIRHDIPWPRLESGALDLSHDTFRQMAKSYAIITPLHELRHAMSEMRLNDLAAGHDGRNRTILSAFRAKTSRNQPSNTRFIFGPSVWLRGLIKPPPGYAVAYVDWSNQEFWIAAKLSGDEQKMAAYLSGDPYIAFGEQCGKLPKGATKASHPDTRQLLKGCVLGVLFDGDKNFSVQYRAAGNRSPRSAARTPRDVPKILAPIHYPQCEMPCARLKGASNVTRIRFQPYWASYHARRVGVVSRTSHRHARLSNQRA
jgi:DNA polymerase I